MRHKDEGELFVSLPSHAKSFQKFIVFCLSVWVGSCFSHHVPFQIVMLCQLSAQASSGYLTQVQIDWASSSDGERQSPSSKRKRKPEIAKKNQLLHILPQHRTGMWTSTIAVQEILNGVDSVMPMFFPIFREKQ